MLTSDLNGAAFVKRYSLKLLEHGIEEGSSLELAQALFPNLKTAPFEPEKDFEALKKLAAWAVQFTPLVGIDREALQAAKKNELLYLNSQYMGIILNITGTERLYGKQTTNEGTVNERAVNGGAVHLARKIYRALTQHSYKIQLGAAPTIGAAWALSRYGSLLKENTPFLQATTKQEIKEKLTDLPLESLRLPHATVKGLQDLGLYNIRSVLTLPRKELATRFGIKLIRALDEFFGDIPEPLTPVHISEDLTEEMVFDPPLITRQQIVDGILLTLEALLKRAEALHRKPLLFRFILTGTNDYYQSFRKEKRISLHAGTDDAKYLRTTLSPIVELIRFPGTVSEVLLEVCDEGIAKPDQISSEPSLAAKAETPKELLNTLTLQLGGGANPNTLFQGEPCSREKF